MKLWLHDETGRTVWTAGRPSARWHEVETCYEDELPPAVSEGDYSIWYDLSEVVDGVRMGPRLYSKDGCSQ